MVFSNLERRRLSALSDLAIFDTDPEPVFDRLTSLASTIFETPIALISLIDRERQWFKSCLGLGVNSTPRDVAFCDIAIRNDAVMVVHDATQDPRFCLNPLVTGDPHIRFYAGAPLRHQGVLIGTLCIIDRVARPEFADSDKLILQSLADSVSGVLEMRRAALQNQSVIHKLQETQKKLEMMEEVAGVGYWHVDLKEQEVTWSKGVYAIHGVDRETYRPDFQTAIEWYHPDDRAVVAEAMSRTASTGEECEFDLRLVRADGEVRRVYCRGALDATAEGSATAIIGVFQDVTDQRRAEHILDQARQAAEDYAKAQSDFIANMSHEIRTPLTTIIGYSDLLAETDMPSDCSVHLAKIRRAGKMLLGLINDVLDVAKLGSGQVILNNRPTNVTALFEDIVAQFEGLASSKGLGLSLSVEPNFPHSLLVDDVRLGQVLTNLVGNACKFTAAGKVDIRLSHLAPLGSATLLRADVIDTGTGLDPVQIAGLFKRFQQADHGINRQYGGSGLGLFISKEILNLMGGRIGVEASLGSGSHFWFEVPLSDADAPLPQLQKVTQHRLPAKTYRVLVVEDHLVNRDLIGRLIDPFVFERIDAVNGYEAVEACRHQAFDLIFMDVHMPVLGGIDAARQIRSLPGPNSQTPIVALTATRLEDLRIDPNAGLFADVIPKPIDPEKLLGAFLLCASEVLERIP